MNKDTKVKILDYVIRKRTITSDPIIMNVRFVDLLISEVLSRLLQIKRKRDHIRSVMDVFRDG